MNRFCEHHILTLLSETKEVTPLDSQLRTYFRSNKAIGAKDRRIISETVYGYTRWKGLINFFSKGASLSDKITLFSELATKDFIISDTPPPHVAVSFPKELYQAIAKAYNEEAPSICRELNKGAPPTIRANCLKISRDSLLKKFRDYGAEATKHSPYGITFPKRINFFGMEEFKAGLFEMQDEGSQVLADLVAAKPGDHVLDYCAGSGGKSLAFAHKLEGKGQIYLHDVRAYALTDAKKRLKRAGIQNAQLVSTKGLKKQGMQGRMDWALLDVPCSGTGTLRRNPDMKWKLTSASVEELTQIQREIFDKAFPLVKTHGYIVYGTCSILPDENDEQVRYFLENYPVALVKKPFKSLPKEGGMDGFFGAVFKKLEDRP